MSAWSCAIGSAFQAQCLYRLVHLTSITERSEFTLDHLQLDKGAVPQIAEFDKFYLSKRKKNSLISSQILHIMSATILQTKP